MRTTGKRRRHNNRRGIYADGILIVIAIIGLITVVVLSMLIIKSLGNNGESNTPASPDYTQSGQNTGTGEWISKEYNENTTESIMETTEADTDPEAAYTKEQDTVSTESNTNSTDNTEWDLMSLSNEEVPFGNDPDQQTDAGIPSGVFWYNNKWGQYNVDFISDIGIKYNKGESDEKIIYLTMDCGFDNEYTAPILDILKEKDVKATFFVTSMFYDARPDLIKRMIEEGHTIGSHSINHKNMTTLSVEEQTEEIMDVINKLKKDYNYDCKLFRFPEGIFSDRCLALVSNLGLKSVFWSYAYNDFQDQQPDIQASYEKAVKYLHPGAIYLLHASSSTNRAFLADWIDTVRNQGYTFGGGYPVS